jgi:hypothetical protein
VLGEESKKLRAYGGGWSYPGGAGTVYTRKINDSLAPYGTLVVDNNGVSGQQTILPSLGVGVAQGGSDNATLVTNRTSMQPYFVGRWVEVRRASGEIKGVWRVKSFTVPTQTPTPTLTLEANTEYPELNVSEGDTWQGVYRFDSLTVTRAARLQSADPIRAGELLLESGGGWDNTQPITVGNATLGAAGETGEMVIQAPVRATGKLTVVGTVSAVELRAQNMSLGSWDDNKKVEVPGVLRHPHGASLVIDVAERLEIREQGRIDVSGRGNAMGEPGPGGTPQGTWSGGSHVGVGGVYSGPAASSYGSVYRPQEGGGGGITGSATRGGGVVTIKAGALSLNGTINADGGDSSNGGHGAGGSVWIRAGSVSGTGSLHARGGQGSNDGSGAGGGGSTAIEYASEEGSVLSNVAVNGGDVGPGTGTAQDGGAGTLYLRDTDSQTNAYGDLVVDNQGINGQQTVLPSLGSGVAQAGSGGAELVALAGATTNGLVGRWTFDEQAGSTARDVSEGANTATLANGASWADGHLGGALSLNGVDQYAEVADSAAFGSMQMITLAAWIKPNRITSTRQEIVCFKGSDLANVGAVLALHENDGSRVRMWVKVGSAWQGVTSSGTITVGEWHHVLGSYDGATVRVYIDGVLQGSTSAAGTMANGNHVVTIGARSPNRQNYFGGAVDDVQIYNRALASDEVAKLYGIQPYFVGHWVEVRSAAGELKGTWRIGSIEGTKIALEPNVVGEVIDIDPNDTWQGVYRFDSVTVRGNARVTIGDATDVPPDKILVVTTGAGNTATTLTGPNRGAPVLSAAADAIWFSYVDGSWHLKGEPGAVSDADQPLKVTIVALKPGLDGLVAASAPSEAAMGGSFDLTLNAVAGEIITLKATDNNPTRPLSTTLEIGPVPQANQAPKLNLAGSVAISYEQATCPGVPGCFADDSYQVTLAPGAISDDAEGKVSLRLRVDQSSCEVAGEVPLVRPGGSGDAVSQQVQLRFTNGALCSTLPVRGQTLTLTATDQDALSPLSAQGQLGALPLALATWRMTLLPLGLGYQIVGAAGAVPAPGVGVEVVLGNGNPERPWSSSPVVVASDGSFYSRVVGLSGDPIVIADAAVSAKQKLVGALPALGVTSNEVALGGHTVAALRGGEAILDGGTAASRPTLRLDAAETEAEMAEPLLAGFGQVHDAVVSLADPSITFLLDGGQVRPVLCSDSECVTTESGLAVTTDVLVKGAALDGYLFLASEGASPALHVLAEPEVDTGSMAITSSCTPKTVTLSESVGAHVLEVFPASNGRVAMLLDSGGGEVVMVDASSSAAPVVSGSIVALSGSASPPVWASWVNGELLLGRNDGSAEIWRWGANDELVRYTAVLPRESGVLARAAARNGTQLWIGTSSGTLDQVDISNPAQPEHVAWMPLDGAVAAMSDLESSLLVATSSELLHIWPTVMPPEINPDRVQWGHGSGRSWVQCNWLDSEGGYQSNGYTAQWGEVTAECYTSPCRVNQDIATAPTLSVRSEHGIPSGAYTPSTWHAWGLGVSDRFPSGSAPMTPTVCAIDRGTFGVVNNSSTGNRAVPWIATASVGSASVELVVNFLDTLANISSVRTTVDATGPITELLSADDALLIADEGLGVWDLRDPATPVLQSHTDLFGPSVGVEAARLGYPNGQLEVLLAGGEQLVVATGNPFALTLSDAVALPSLAGRIVDLARGPDGYVYVLSESTSGSALSVYDLVNISAPVLLRQMPLEAGAPAVAIDVGGRWSSTDDPFVAVVRQGLGLEIYGASGSSSPRVVQLNGAARDVFVASDPFDQDCSGINRDRLVVALGFGNGVARVTGAEDGSPIVTYVELAGDPLRFAEGRMSTSVQGSGDAQNSRAEPTYGTSLLTPRGFVWIGLGWNTSPCAARGQGQAGVPALASPGNRRR